MGDVCLPQHDPRPAERAAALHDARVVWDYGHWHGLRTFARTTPARELPHLGWVLRILPGVVRVAVNDGLHYLWRCLGRLQWKTHPPRTPRKAPARPPLRGVPEARSSNAHSIIPIGRRMHLWAFTRLDRQLVKTLGDYGTGAAPSDPATPGAGPRLRPGVTLADFIGVYRALPVPPLVARWQQPGGGLTDAAFAWLRLAGPNPEVLDRVDAVPDGFPAALQIPGDGPAAAAASEGRLFLADYGALRVLKGSSWHGIPRYVSAPRALFAASRDALVPVAIECDPGAGVFQPGDAGWELAKHVVQVADGNHHELVSHLARTHLLVEIFLMATRRHLAANHPIARLLLPHFEGTVFINDQARTSLIAAGGAIDRIFAGTIDSAQDLAVQALQALDLAGYDLPTRTAAHRTEAIAIYPWRDDALRVWRPLAAFVGKVVTNAYPNPGDLSGDTEIAAWSETLAKPVGAGGVAGFAPPRTREELARILTTVIFTASAQHAAVNFTQFPIMSFAPLVAGSGWASPPVPGAEPSDLIPFLPPRQLALQQADVLYLLSSVHHTQLGGYAREWFGDPTVDVLADGLRRDLATVEAAIEAENRRRPEPYTHLLPSLIPQSINI